jgi:hypothetical protein
MNQQPSYRGKVLMHPVGTCWGMKSKRKEEREIKLERGPPIGGETINALGNTQEAMSIPLKGQRMECLSFTNIMNLAHSTLKHTHTHTQAWFVHSNQHVHPSHFITPTEREELIRRSCLL